MASRIPDRQCAREGISLLEVLISMGIMVIGLLSVAALFPVGHFHVSKANRMDRAAAVGQAVFGEIKTRGLLRLDPYNLLPADGSSFPRQPDRNLLRVRALAIDPLWCSQPGNAQGVETPFPYNRIQNPSVPIMERVTLSQFPGSSAMTPAMAEQLFMSHDDLSLEFPTDRDQPSIALFRSDGSGQPLQRQFQGDYSWIFTVVPAEVNSPSDLFTVSVVVFHKRRLQRLTNDPTPPELMLPAPTAPPVSGPGFVEVEWSSPGMSALAETKPGQWVMLSGKDTNLNRDIFRWYRVMMVQSDTATGVTRLMLAGPQWNPTIITPYVSIFEGAVGVYEKTMHIEGPSLY